MLELSWLSETDLLHLVESQTDHFIRYSTESVDNVYQCYAVLNTVLSRILLGLCRINLKLPKWLLHNYTCHPLRHNFIVHVVACPDAQHKPAKLLVQLPLFV